jgi:putative PIN family toxin of toxin-antitoxin system
VRVILDTNVVISAVFFGGVPGQILTAWHEGRLQLIVSPSILSEYRRVGAILSESHEGVDFEPFAALLAVHAFVVDAPDHLAEPVCRDPNDDQFLACALAADVTCIISGDGDLLEVSGWNGIEVLRPRPFVTRYLG